LTKKEKEKEKEMNKKKVRETREKRFVFSP